MELQNTFLSLADYSIYFEQQKVQQYAAFLDEKKQATSTVNRLPQQTVQYNANGDGK